MGEYADMMLDGTCCSQCGQYLGGDEGYPVTCIECQEPISRANRTGGGWECPLCRRNFGSKGAKMNHLKDFHKSKFDNSGRVIPISTQNTTNNQETAK